jgi:hypothetical protein
MAHLAIVAATILALGTGASAAPGEPVEAPASIVRGHSLTHSPTGLTIGVPKTATYVGSDRFDLYGVADAEVQVFVEADAKKRVTRLYWIQFESYWPSKPEHSYNYTGDRREQHWGTTVWVNAGAGATSAPTRPGSDRQHVLSILERAGYIPPAEMMRVRLIQLLDDPKGTGRGRQELMFIYAEDLAATGNTLADVTTNDEPNANWVPIEKGLVERAVKAFSVERK